MTEKVVKFQILILQTTLMYTCDNFYQLIYVITCSLYIIEVPQWSKDIRVPYGRGK